MSQNEDKKACEDAWDKDIELRELTSMEEFIMKLIHNQESSEY
jgi:hypothetical protein